MVVSIPEAIEAFRRGEVLIMTDDEDRENEGDFVCAAEACTPAIINFMATHGRGLICVPMTAERMNELGLSLMVPDNTALMGTNFTVSVDAVQNTTTGISASDRSETVRVMADPNTKAADLARPGHIFPIVARRGGVLRRAGHTEGVSDLARLAGFSPVGVLCEILNEDGTMARMPDLEIIAEQHNLKIVTIRDLIAYRVQTEHLVERAVETTLPNHYGTWRMFLYENMINGETHVALVMGDISGDKPVLVRVHSSCFTGDTLGSMRCDCGAQLDAAMAQIASEGCGILLYMQQEGRGIGLKNKLRAYALQDQGKDTVEANVELGFKPDARDYGIGAQILRDIGVRHLRLMTNNPRKMIGLEGYGLKLADRVPLEVGHHDLNRKYLMTKQSKLGHLFSAGAVVEEVLLHKPEAKTNASEDHTSEEKNSREV